MPRARTTGSAWPARTAAVVLVILGFIPWASFLDVGLEMKDLDVQTTDWLTGTILTIGVGLLAWVFSRRGHWPRAWAHGASPTAAGGQPRGVYLVALGSLILFATVATTVFSRRPLLIDEVVQLWQAQRFAEGRLWVPAAAHREFFSFLHLVDVGDRVYSQFPPGGPFMLWLGVLAGAPWLVGPVCGALSVLLFARVARAAEPEASDRWLLGATTLFAIAPFGVFMFSSHMNHVTALLWILVAVVALISLTRTAEPVATRRTLRIALVLGFGLGAAATIRPLDAFAFALPAAIWLVVRAKRSPHRWLENVVAGVGVAIPFAAMMYVNIQTTGHPLRFGYEVLWGATHGLGFHAAPWGVPHTPLRGFALAGLYQWRLQTYLFETPFPSLVLPVAALALWRRVGALDRYLLASSAFLIFFYFLYWHDGLFLGPRFVFPLLPVLVLWTARLPLVLRERIASSHARHALWGAFAFGVVGACVFNLPVRVAIYGASFTTMRADYSAVTARNGVRDALVFVRESWGAQLVARLWGQGVSRPVTELAYRSVDACNLEQAVSAFEREGITDADAERRLSVLIAQDSAFVDGSRLSSDPTERMRPGVSYTPRCIRRIEEDLEGFVHYVPLRLITTGGNIFARDLHGRDSLLLAEYPSRPVYLLKRKGSGVSDPLVFVPLRRDSLMAAWRAER